MTVRLCLIGSSHLGALKLGADTMQPTPAELGVTPTFFAAPAKTLAETRLTEDGLVPTSPAAARSFLRTSGGLKAVRFADYDAFALVGWNLRARSLFGTYLQARAEEHARVDGDRILVSDDCFDAAAQGLIRASTAWKAAQHIAAAIGRPVLIVPEPEPSDDPARTSMARALWRDIATGPDAAALAACFVRNARALCSGLVSFLPQVPETLAGPMVTKLEYSRGSLRLSGRPHGETDLGHMNDAYGRLMMAACVRWALAAVPAPLPA